MSLNTVIILLIVFNLLAMHHAYRLDSNSEGNQGLTRSPDDNVNNQDRLSYLFDLKNKDEDHIDNSHDSIPCYIVSSTYIICKKFDQFSRRDTGFLRFGRK